MYRFVLVLLAFLSVAAGAQSRHRASAYREPGADYRGYKAMATLFDFDGLQTPDRITPMQAARSGKLNDLPPATEWENSAVMTERFERFRDLRFITQDLRPNFPRRSSWLYPDDGCFARAALAVRNLAQWNAPLPKKVFAFGNLTVKTPNAHGGSVSWWYHVAPLVEINNQKYVLDPALSPKKVLTLNEWLLLMTDTPGDVSGIEVSVCESGAYTPGDDCSHVSDGKEEGALQDQEYYLDEEWNRLLQLKRKPDLELGEFPPWLN